MRARHRMPPHREREFAQQLGNQAAGRLFFGMNANAAD
ncbi:hypothetical protein Z948_501 [Sulfitobacter donghicola DSW-25 = KCTC 12864 = JCM 14565]|nr:hypothetical protein Z948_501 [Sulfitobacter donghicola DSW-25 = KCTC 12864 = JCM 14565]